MTHLFEPDPADPRACRYCGRRAEAHEGREGHTMTPHPGMPPVTPGDPHLPDTPRLVSPLRRALDGEIVDTRELLAATARHFRRARKRNDLTSGSRDPEVGSPRSESIKAIDAAGRAAAKARAVTTPRHDQTPDPNRARASAVFSYRPGQPRSQHAQQQPTDDTKPRDLADPPYRPGGHPPTPITQDR